MVALGLQGNQCVFSGQNLDPIVSGGLRDRLGKVRQIFLELSAGVGSAIGTLWPSLSCGSAQDVADGGAMPTATTRRNTGGG